MMGLSRRSHVHSVLNRCGVGRDSAWESLETLESRRYMSFVYEGFGPLESIANPDRESVASYYGPLAVIADIDEDGVRDVLVGNAGMWVAGRSGGDLFGAMVLSGRDASLLRLHDEDEVARYGWSVADIGDTDGDGVSDYAVGTGALYGEQSAFLYSGATGTLIRSHELPGTGGANVAAAGDLNNDGVPDVLVGYLDANRVFAYSGADGSTLWEVQGSQLDISLDRVGAGLAGGADLNGDEVPDVLIFGQVPGPRTIWAVSGVDGALLWDQNAGSGISDFSGPNPLLIPDRNSDGFADVAFASESSITILSGADGGVFRVLELGQQVGIGGLALAGDIDGDQIADFAMGSTAARSTNPRALNGGVLIISGETGAILSVLADTRDNTFGGYASFGNDVVAADLDGDGRSEVIAIAKRYSGYMQPGFARTYIFEGTDIGVLDVRGLTSGAVSRSIVWGMSSNQAFIIRDSVRSNLVTAGVVNEGDVIIALYEGRDGLLLVVADDATGASPSWITTSHGLTDTVRQAFDALTIIGAPAGTLTNPRVIAAADGVVLIQQTLDGDTPTAWLADLSESTLTYLFTGTPVAVAVDHLAPSGEPRPPVVVGSAHDRPGVGLLWITGTLAELDGTPVAISPSGRWAVGTRTVENGPEQVVLIDLIQSPLVSAPIPLIEGGEDFAPIGVNDAGHVVGSYTNTTTSPQRRSGFYYDPISGVSSDIATSQMFGAPNVFIDISIGELLGPTSTGDVLIRHGTQFALLSYASSTSFPGPSRAGETAPISIAITGTGEVYVVTRNAAGEVLNFVEGSGGWSANNLFTNGFFEQMHFGELLSWVNDGDFAPTFVLARTDGLLLFETVDQGLAGWRVRNLTAEIIGAEAIVDGLVTLVPRSGLRLVGGLNADGELLLYGQTVQMTSEGDQVWAYDNLYESVVYPTSTPPPAFRQYTGAANLVGYVTGWDGQNIAGIAGGGQIVVFWTAPGIQGWRITNLAQVSTGDSTASSGFRTLQVALTPWNGINLYGENDAGAIQVTWWVPQFTDHWQADVLVPGAGQVVPAANTRSLTAYATPWGGLNVARVDQDGMVEVYWWSAQSNGWQHEVLNPQVSSHLASFRAVGKLQSAVSSSGQINIFARNEFGDIMRFFWDPENPWRLERL